MNKLTREEILAMKSGQMDRYIHEKLFGGEDLSEFEYKGNGSYVKVTETSVIWRDVPNYSTDISAAWEVVEVFKTHQVTKSEKGFSHSDMKYRVIVGKNQNVAYANSAPEAICKAALLAVLEGEE